MNETLAIEIAKLAFATDDNGFRKFGPFSVVQNTEQIILQGSYQIWDDQEKPSLCFVKIYSDFDVVCYSNEWVVTNTQNQVKIFELLKREVLI